MQSYVQVQRQLTQGVPGQGCLSIIRQTFTRFLCRCAQASLPFPARSNVAHTSGPVTGVTKTIHEAEANARPQSTGKITQAVGFKFLEIMAPVLCSEKAVADTGAEGDVSDNARISGDILNRGNSPTVSPGNFSSQRESLDSGSSRRESMERADVQVGLHRGSGALGNLQRVSILNVSLPRETSAQGSLQRVNALNVSLYRQTPEQGSLQRVNVLNINLHRETSAQGSLQRVNELNVSLHRQTPAKGSVQRVNVLNVSLHRQTCAQRSLQRVTGLNISLHRGSATLVSLQSVRLNAQSRVVVISSHSANFHESTQIPHSRVPGLKFQAFARQLLVDEGSGKRSPRRLNVLNVSLHRGSAALVSLQSVRLNAQSRVVVISSHSANFHESTQRPHSRVPGLILQAFAQQLLVDKGSVSAHLRNQDEVPFGNHDRVVRRTTTQGRQFQEFAARLLWQGSNIVVSNSTRSSAEQPSKWKDPPLLTQAIVEAVPSRAPAVCSFYTDGQGYRIPKVRLPVIRMEDIEWQIGDDGEIRVLGSGSFGSVAAAYFQTSDGPVREVAVKRYLREGLGPVIREAKMMAYLSDTGAFPAFYGIVDTRDDSSKVCLVSELFASGQTLWDAIHSSSNELTRRDWHSVAVQAACALRRIHAKGVIFNDLKSNNLLLDTSFPGQPVLRFIDVGLSTYQRGMRYSLTSEEMGRYPHIAPEVKLGVPTNCLSDVWGLGLVLLDISKTRLIPELEGVAMAALACYPSERAKLDDIIKTLEAVRCYDSQL